MQVIQSLPEPIHKLYIFTMRWISILTVCGVVKMCKQEQSLMLSKVSPTFKLTTRVSSYLTAVIILSDPKPIQSGTHFQELVDLNSPLVVGTNSVNFGKLGMFHTQIIEILDSDFVLVSNILYLGTYTLKTPTYTT